MASTATRLFSQFVIYLPLQWSLFRHLAKILEVRFTFLVTGRPVTYTPQNGGAKLASSYREQGVTIIIMVLPTLQTDTSMTRLLMAEYRTIALGQGRVGAPPVVPIEWLYYLLSHQSKPSIPNPQLDKFKLSL